MTQTALKSFMFLPRGRLPVYSRKILSSFSSPPSKGKRSMAHSSVPHIPTPIQLCRFMQPGDANISGNVHGGTILKMIEEAGMIASTRFCNQDNDKDDTGVLCVLARVERTDFCLPMYVGEVAHLHGEVTFTSKHSLEVQMSVWGENVMKNTKRLTNKATLWYVPMTGSNTIHQGGVPELQYISEAMKEAALMRYQKQKEERATVNDVNLHTDFSTPAVQPELAEAGTVAHAQSSLIHLVNVNDCGIHGKVTGGTTMKMMDEAAGICAARHCHTNVVTASMDATNFHRPIGKGCVMHLKSRPIFTSNKSIEIEVVVDVEQVRLVDASTQVQWYRACSAFFTFVSLDANHRPLPIPSLIRKTPAEEERFRAGEARYQNRKSLRNKM
ncbi:putative cytosolic acyl coenzyme A thioester hydrolase-like [Styela clava]|uniref:cytosolic acyl coenzyme A thioester hydrolase-like n=1 Tax=Styela clava TaxID=7725 RepID=UPI00193AB2D3|nr:cytosolic acyl coenzyme A thioester hydrolase-like [Styela clava]